MFDSLGFRPDLIVPYLKFREKLSIDYNKTQVQSNESISCGKFVIYLCADRMLNMDLSFQMILEDIFVENTQVNEKNVLERHGELGSAIGRKSGHQRETSNK